MIDNLSILLSHALLLYMFYHLVTRDDLDDEAPPPPFVGAEDTSRFRRKPTPRVDVDPVTEQPAPRAPRPLPGRIATSPKGRRDA